MEAAYRRAVAGKRRVQDTGKSEKGEKRRLIQLLVSLGLFLIVFIGRGAFPTQTAAWSELLAKNADFAAAFERFSEEIAGGESVWNALGRMAAASFGAEVPEPQVSEQPGEPTLVPDEIVLLSDTELHGLLYLRQNGLQKYQESTERDPETPAVPERQEPSESVQPEPEIVTAVAQAYAANGEALPSNVSFQYYELGLKNTLVPVMGTVTSDFGFRTGPISGKHEFHLAIDIAAPKGTDILAFSDGVVRYIGENDSFGLYLMIDHDNGVSTFYAHCSKLLVRKGDVITCGQTVALVGETGSATGPHLHFTLLKDNVRLDPAYYVDPEQ